jgi:uncharacterized membrane protein YbhN (UPF0104 family)
LLLCAFVLASFDWASILVQLGGINLWPLLGAMGAITLAVFLTCALRWMAINQLPWRCRTVANVYVYVSVVIGAAIATPMQLGEILKVRFARDAGLPFGRSAVNLALERVIDLAAITGMLAGGLVFGATASSGLASLAVLGIFLAGMCAPAVLQGCARRFGARPWGERLASLAGEPLPALRLAVVALTTLVKWGLTLLVWMLAITTVGLPVSFWQSMLLVGGVTGLSIISLVPGGIGVQEVSVRALLVMLGHDPLQSEAAALVLRLFTPVMAGLGLAHIPLLSRKRATSDKVPSHG